MTPDDPDRIRQTTPITQSTLAMVISVIATVMEMVMMIVTSWHDGGNNHEGKGSYEQNQTNDTVPLHHPAVPSNPLYIQPISLPILSRL